MMRCWETVFSPLILASSLFSFGIFISFEDTKAKECFLWVIFIIRLFKPLWIYKTPLLPDHANCWVTATAQQQWSTNHWWWLTKLCFTVSVLLKFVGCTNRVSVFHSEQNPLWYSMSLGRALSWTDHIVKISQTFLLVASHSFIHCFQLRMYWEYLYSSTSIFKSQNKDEKQKHETNWSKLHEKTSFSCFSLDFKWQSGWEVKELLWLLENRHCVENEGKHCLIHAGSNLGG